MRIIAGSAKGRRIVAPSGMHVRPTGDRVRQSLFDMLAVRSAGGRVLDLFAGSGALGLEALSRGAESAAFVDKSRDSIRVVRKNIESCGFQDRTTVLSLDFKAAIARLEREERRFDLVFVDPPYVGPQRDAALVNVVPVLAKGAYVVVETAATETAPKPPEVWELDAERKFGRTLVYLFRYG